MTPLQSPKRKKTVATFIKNYYNNKICNLTEYEPVFSEEYYVNHYNDNEFKFKCINCNNIYQEFF